MPPQKPSERGERTRAAILDAAEAEFADRGFAAARVDTIAESAGIRRATLFHHYPDKPAIYAAVLEDRVLPYFEQVRKLLDEASQQAPGSSGIDPILQGISLQAEFFARHPQIARIFLREISDFDPERPSHLGELIGPLVREVTHFLEERLGTESGHAVDPEHLITAVAGASLLHVVGSPLLHAGRSTAPLRGAELERHERELARLVARLLDVDDPPRPLPAGAEE